MANPLDRLSFPTPKRLAFKLHTKAERMVRKGHPWVFSDSIIKTPEEAGNPGDLAIIFDQKKNKFLALGLYDPHSPIRIKILQAHHSAQINETWFKNKIQEAFQRRVPLFESNTNAYRLIHGENDGLPSLIADVYADVLVLKIYAQIWIPYLPVLAPILLQQAEVKTLILRLSRQLEQETKDLPLHDGMILIGSLAAEEVFFSEHGLQFKANVIHGHKTGFFLDQRHNRLSVQERSKGKTVLDIFSYSGGFSVHALAGGAKEVTSLDLNSQALQTVRQNVGLNFGETTHQIIKGDAFEEMEKLAKAKKRYDFVIIDPPSFANKADLKAKALYQYGRLVDLALPLITKTGLLFMASCSSRVPADDFFETIETKLRASKRSFSIINRTFHDIDHPIEFPEGAYLKALFIQFEG